MDMSVFISFSPASFRVQYSGGWPINRFGMIEVEKFLAVITVYTITST
jgi:hypothetical protein